MQRKVEKIFLVLEIMAFEGVAVTYLLYEVIHVIGSQRVTKQS